jgi:lipopolysaccharide export system permease protein
MDVVGEMLGLRVVLASVYCLPMAMLLAGLLAFGRLSGDSEVIAMQAGGVPNLRIIVNAFVLGLALSVAGVAINEYVIPPAGRRLEKLEAVVKTALKGKVLEDLADQKAFVVQDYEGGKLSRVIIAKRFEPAEPPRPALMRSVTYMQYEKGQVQMLVEADRAEWIGDDKDHPGRQWWRFIDAKTQLMSQVTRGQKWVWEANDMKFYMNKPVQQAQQEQKEADEMTYRELKSYLQQIRQQGPGAWAGGKVEKQRRVVRELEVDLERKLSVPFAALVFALIGAPLGIRKQRSTAGVGIGLSLLIIIAYYIGMSFLSVLGQNGQLAPLYAAWGCNAAGLLMGLGLIWRSSR